MQKKLFFLFSGVLLITSFLYSQPQVIPNEVTLYLSTGEVKTGLLIEMKIDVSPKNRTLIIWTHSDGYITYPVQDIEALTQNYTRDQVARDFTSLKWRDDKDYIVFIKPSTGQQTDIIKGLFSGYNNVKGIYYNIGQEYKWKEIGAIYFFNSNHAHFTSLPNEFAQQPTLVKNVVPENNEVTDARREIFKKRHQGRRDENDNKEVISEREILKQKPQRRPDVVINLPASQPVFRGNDVNAGVSYYIEVEGAIKINPVVEVGVGGYAGDVNNRYKAEVATGVPLVFIAPQSDPHIKIPMPDTMTVLNAHNIYVTPTFGSMCFTINDSYYKDNSGSFQIRLWKLN